MLALTPSGKALPTVSPLRNDVPHASLGHKMYYSPVTVRVTLEGVRSTITARLQVHMGGDVPEKSSLDDGTARNAGRTRCWRRDDKHTSIAVAV